MLYAILQNYLNIWLLLPTKAQISKKCHKYSTCLCKTCWCSLACGSLVKPPGVCVLLHGLWHMCVAAGAIKICETINNISAQREIATVTHTHTHTHTITGNYSCSESAQPKSPPNFQTYTQHHLSFLISISFLLFLLLPKIHANISFLPFWSSLDDVRDLLDVICC